MTHESSKCSRSPSASEAMICTFLTVLFAWRCRRLRARHQQYYDHISPAVEEHNSHRWSSRQYHALHDKFASGAAATVRS
jgi:hypothetical protein